jgi:hypothetical protein
MTVDRRGRRPGTTVIAEELDKAKVHQRARTNELA